MRVLQVFKIYLPDGFTGVEHVIYEIAEGTRTLGIEHSVFSLSRNPKPEGVAVAHHRAYSARLDLDIASTPISLSARSLYRDLVDGSDVVHLHFPWPMMDVLHLTTGGRKPTIVTYHSDVVKQRSLMHIYRPLMHRLLARADRIVATSPTYAETSSVLRRFKEKTTVIPIGIDASAGGTDPARTEAWRHRLGNRFFLFVGQFRYYKGIDFLLDAAARSRLPVVLAGGGDLREKINSRGLVNVQVVSPLNEDDKNALLELCLAVVLPSHLRSEAFGIVLAEGLRAGKPLISCEIGTGTSYVNLNGETGITVPPADGAALARAMLALWNAPDMAANMGFAARRRFDELFAAKTMAHRYAKLYREVFEASDSRAARSERQE